MEKIVAGVERFRAEMARAGIDVSGFDVSGFEVRTSTQEQMLEAMAAGITVTKRRVAGPMVIAGMRVLVMAKEPRS